MVDKAILIKNVTKRYSSYKGEGILAIDRVQLEITDGEFLAVVGPSGCGKSTLLKLVTGLIAATDGQVWVNGQEVTGPVDSVGIVFQKSTLLEWRTALQNVMLQVEMRHLDKGTYEPRARELLSSVGLTGFEDKRPWELSGGMQQRVAICRALIHDPLILLMDEPFGALDALTREQMRVDLEQVWLSKRKTVMFITHSISEAVLLADRVAVMTPRPGRIQRIIEVNLPRPRKLDAQDNPVFRECTHSIRDIFLEGGVLHS
jgi:NitT/TauT family transport system ATP-binding protein